MDKTVSLLKQCDYQGVKPLKRSIEKLLRPITLPELKGKKVLIKPNLLKPREVLATTEPVFLAAVVEIFCSKGATILIADSPAFGSAEGVAKKNGHLQYLKHRGLKIHSLKDAKRINLPSGVRIGLSRYALECDFIVNVPRLKAHCQFGITGSVKNLYGCVVGVRKALGHFLYGDNHHLFGQIIVDIPKVLPPVLTIFDGILSMSATGPSGGIPKKTGFIGASMDPFSMDTAAYELVGARPEEIPLWSISRELGERGAFIENIDFPLLKPEELMPIDFTFPRMLKSMSFNPMRLLKGRAKSLIRRIFP